ncbi:uncharacterized protein L3040_002905 [Drepanopeziza brunnea f. sp. 'multigermtubi']|uniref:FAR-17a/AIG1-like protein n=1 Tax=Marssonina brunnea f. sp. multigermtubi (strain MB_m1) TaxID=1072389 RepID=K1WXW4_MARBU|nr:uncharacterized protein MBM_04268 [Drepanopeziza brunnea f. sp. 'multigermtubi' MB_m1]EKD17407.1 hypothetical protein MBM_04268 [Drepanopeziza brunnea f. sp. 'multigermtubi' MB_m1]KAJ5047061.1 hypothetical protein L3040_002905 [Drepanopeziza brunnea f. sp. 'multigermtubi']
MSSSTALLPKAKKDDHPIFLRVCHSPWTVIGQKALVGLRALIAVYLLVSFIVLIDYEVKHTEDGYLAYFRFSNVSYMIQLLYHWIAFVWTFMHLHYPHHSSSTSSNATAIQKAFSPPKQNPDTNNRTWFSIFYTLAQTWPLVSAFLHWAILAPKGKTTIPANDTFGHGSSTTFYVIDKYAVSAIIALIEIIFLSSIRRQVPIATHVGGLSFLTALFIGWVYIGYTLTGKCALFFLDNKQMKWEHVIEGWVGLIVVTNIFFSFVYFITGARESLTRKGENKNTGYQSLPQ